MSIESTKRWKELNKEKARVYAKEYYRANKEKNKMKRSIEHKKYYVKNQERIKKYASERYATEHGKAVSRKWAKENRDRINATRKKWLQDNPWLKHYRFALSRCNYKYNNRYKNYGARGIKFKLTKKEIKSLWFRDKAYLMEKPSIDRKNTNGHYTLRNCQFIEKRENSKKKKAKTITNKIRG